MYDFFILFILYTYHYIYCIIIFLAYVNINTFIFLLGVFLTDILHYITAVHPRFSYFFITFINLSMISYL